MSTRQQIAAGGKWLVFGKYLNLGQTCVAPDYLLIDQSIKDAFLEEVKKEIAAQFGENPLENPNYGKIINVKHFQRLKGLMDPEKVVVGGQMKEQTLQIAPTVMDHVDATDAVMGEEIFGPILPVLTYESIGQAERFILSRPHPLALYLFTTDAKTEDRFLRFIPFGGGCINDTIIHLATSRMGFGGVGQSGMGSYHGKKSFETFSHEKSIVKKYNWIDLPVRYQPYTTKKQRLLRFFLR